jgi:DNA-directed RNA polymerase subunit RPC12/RpoP
MSFHIHEWFPSGDGYLVCSVCSAEYGTPEDEETEEDYEMSAITELVCICSECGKRFDSVYQTFMHEQLDHEGDEQF